MRKYIAVALILTAFIATAAINYFNIEGEIAVTESKLSVSPKSFNIEVPKGYGYVKKITIENIGKEANIYFEKVIEGPTPDKISIYFHDIHGNSITSSKKLRIPAGSDVYPTKVTVNVHIDVSKDAAEGVYKVYIQAKG